MGATRKASPFYYYADGERVELTPAIDLIAFDEKVADQDALRSAIGKKGAQATPLSHGIQLLQTKGLTAAAKQQLESSGATHPVFRAAGAVIVALPEIRVEESRSRQKKSLEKWFASHQEEVDVEETKAGRYTIRPKSGRGIDALTLSNTLTEEVGAEMSQARFVRIVTRPDVRERASRHA